MARAEAKSSHLCEHWSMNPPTTRSDFFWDHSSEVTKDMEKRGKHGKTLDPCVQLICSLDGPNKNSWKSFLPQDMSMFLSMRGVLTLSSRMASISQQLANRMQSTCTPRDTVHTCAYYTQVPAQHTCGTRAVVHKSMWVDQKLKNKVEPCGKHQQCWKKAPLQNKFF